jgi:uncharacterized protein (TIGR02300 family)
MSTKADVRAQRGTKRACQNKECGARFYDLNQDPITCPICKTVYVIPLVPAPQVARTGPKPVRKPAFVPDEIKPDNAPEAEGEELIELEGVAEGGEQEEADDAILEADEDTSDVSAIIDAPADDKEEKA